MSLSRIFSPVLHFDDDRGNPLSSGWLCTFYSGTNTPVATYKDASGTLNEVEIQLDSRGECEVWLDSSIVYKFELWNKNKTERIWFKNDISVSSAGSSPAPISNVNVVGDEETIHVDESSYGGMTVFVVSVDQGLIDIINGKQSELPKVGDDYAISITGNAGTADVAERAEKDSSGNNIEETYETKQEANSKADKVSNATADNFAALDASGNLTDSGKKAADFATDEQGVKADTAVQGVKVNGTLLTPDTNKVVNITSESIGLGNVDNTSDDEKKSSFTGAIEPMNTGFATGGDVYDAIAESEAKTGSLGFLSGTGKESVVTNDTAFHALPVDSVKLFFSGDFFDLDDGDRENLEDYEPSNEMQLVSFYVGGEMFTVNLDRSIELPAESVCFSGMVLITEDDTDFEIKVKTSSIDLLSVNMDSISLVKMNHMNTVKKRAYLKTSDNKFVITDDGKRIFSEYNV